MSVSPAHSSNAPNPIVVKVLGSVMLFNLAAAEVGLYEQISRLNNHRPFRLPLMRAVSLNFFGTLSVRYELLAPM